ncbi:uncharacterized protein LOC143253288 isoform X2 [Tachypleus tridentatus]|uniref:uncharacterized protein LOC143253288 isoform X2 n=1 Tax=Tachypleus tridentatus TaxID=6853 RepID=UPI003FCFDC7C
MFNINKFLNRLSDQGKGFLCPSCMLAFPSPEALQDHYESTHIEREREPQSHYNRHHTPQDEQEEKSYSEELKKEVSRLHAAQASRDSSGGSGGFDKAEVEMLRSQIQALGEGKALITSEVILLRQQLSDSLETNKLIKQEKEKLEQKIATVSENLASAKAKLDEATSLKTDFETQIKRLKKHCANMEAEMQQRPGAEDVLVLRQELVTVQRMMDQLALEKESEKEVLQIQYNSLEKKHVQLQEDKEKLEKQLGSAPSFQDIESLHAKLAESYSSSQELQNNLQKMTQETLEFQIKVEQLQEQFQVQQESLNTLQVENEKLKSELETSDQERQQLQKELSNQTQESENLYHKIQEMQIDTENSTAEKYELEKILIQQKEQLKNLLHLKEKETFELQQQMEKLSAKLKEKDSQLQDTHKQISNLQEQYQYQCSANDDLTSQIWEKDSQIQENHRLDQAKEEKVKVLERQVQKDKETIERLETERNELHSKIETGEGANTALQQLRLENTTLQDKIHTLEKAFQEATAENDSKVENLHKQLHKTRSNFQAVQNKSTKLDTQLQEANSNLTAIHEKVNYLESEIKTKSELLAACESAKISQRADLEHHLKSCQKNLEEKSSQLETTRKKLENVEEQLNSRKEEVLKLEHHLSEEVQKCAEWEKKCKGAENALLEKENTIVNLTSENTTLKRETEESNLKLISVEKDAKKTRENFEQKIECFLSEKNKLEKEISELHQFKSNLLTETQELKTQLNISSKELGKAVEEKQAVKEKQENQFKELKLKTDKDFNVLTLEKKELESSLLNLQEKVQQLEEFKQSIQQENEILRKELGDANQMVTKQQEQLQQDKDIEEELQQRIVKHQEQLQLIRNAEQILQHQVMTQEKELEQFKDTEKVLQQQVARQQESLEQNKNMERALQAEINKLEVQCQDLRKELSRMSHQSAVDLSNQQEQIVKLQSVHESLKNQLLATQEQLQLNDHIKSELEAQVNTIKSELEESQNNEAQVNAALENLTEVKKDLSERVLKLDQETEKLRDENQLLEAKRISMETELEEKTNCMVEMVKKNAELQQQVANLEDKYQEELQAGARKAADLKEAKQLMVQQKMALQTQVETLKEELKQNNARYKKEINKLEEAVNARKQEADDLRSELAQETQSKQAQQEEWEAKEAQCETQKSILNENLNTLREDLLNEQSKREQFEKKVDELSGDKLELEAKLDNALDERRVLLERCLNSETECEKLRMMTTELRRKYDDTVAALQELGRENQTLQIENTKHMTRKWADDSEVTHCTTCGKTFTVTVRKHHCRHCGNIFCQECSSKVAMIPSAKKPLRVCDLCYNLLTK